MGASPQPPLLVSLEEMVLENKGMNKPSGSLWSRVLEAQAKRKWQKKKQMVSKIYGRGHLRNKRVSRVLMKRRAVVEASRRSGGGIQRRVKTLKKLIPNSESMGLDGLFRDTADYILSLQMKVRAMQVMVEVLSGSDDPEGLIHS